MKTVFESFAFKNFKIIVISHIGKLWDIIIFVICYDLYVNNV